MNQTRFGCAQQDLYLVCRLGWKACLRQLPAFTAFKPLYTEGYITERLLEVKAAEEIPDSKSRRDSSTETRIFMVEAIGECLACYQSLKRYIETAFPPSLYKSKLEAAGKSYFVKASNLNRQAASNLNTTALQFIKNNKQILYANNNMPATFLEQYQTCCDRYKTLQEDYIGLSTDAKIVTTDNTDANNDLYDKVISMFKDAQEVFRKSPQLQAQFTFSSVLFAAVGSGTATIRGLVTNGLDDKAIEKAQVKIQYDDKFVETNKKGKYEINQLAGGKYNVVITAQGFKDVLIEDFEVKTDTFNQLDVAMELILILANVN
jgi:Carboxypeptidase regulatory-like domain